MQASKLNEWLNLGASVGVLVGLLIVAYEVRQTGQAAFAEMRGNMLSHYGDINTSSYGPEILSLVVNAMKQPGELTDEELWKVNEWFTAQMTVVHRNAVNYYDFGWSGDPAEGIRSWPKNGFNSSIARAWFEFNKNWLHPKMREIIQHEIDTSPVRNQVIYVALLREKMAEINAAVN